MPMNRLVWFVSSLLVALTISPSFAQKEKNKLTAPQPPEPVAPTPYTGVRRENLLNGLQISTLEVSSEKNIVCELVVRGGSAYDLVGRSGLAMLTASTLLATDPNLDSAIASYDAKLDWGVTKDTTWFRIEAPAQYLEGVLDRLARSLVKEAIYPDIFKTGQQNLLAKLKSLSPGPAKIADDAFYASLYGDFPYGRVSEGTPAGVSAAKIGDVIDFYNRVYVANNIFAVVHGNLKHEQIMSLFRVKFGGWVKGVVPSPTFRPPARVTEVKVKALEDKGVAEAEIRGGILGVSHTDPDFITTLVLARVLDKRLKATFPSASATFASNTLPGPFYFSATAPAAIAQDLSRRMSDIFATLNTQEFSELEVAQAQSGIVKDHQARSVPSYLVEIGTFKLPETYPLVFESRVKAVTTFDLQRVAKRLLEANAITLTVFGNVNADGKAPSQSGF